MYPSSSFFKAAVKSARSAYTRKPNDLQATKNLAKALVGLKYSGESKKTDFRYLNEAVSLFNRVLTNDPKDHLTRFNLGFAYYNILEWNNEYDMLDSNAKDQIFDQAINCLKILDAEVPNRFPIFRILEELQSRCVEDRRTIFADWSDIELFQSECDKNPNVSENWRKWGAALLSMADCQGDYSGNERRGMIAGVIPKLENALALDPDNKKAKKKLLEAYGRLIQLFKGTDLYSIKKECLEDSETSNIGWSDIELFQSECDKNPNVSENWRKWGAGLLSMSDCHDSCNNETRRRIAEAIPKLENALALDPHNKKAKKKLSEAYGRLFQLFKGSDLYSSSVVKGENTEDDETDIIDDEFFRSCKMNRSWKKWGKALMKLSCHESGFKKSTMIAEAIAKLEMAYLKNLNDEEVKEKLKEAYGQLLAKVAVMKAQESDPLLQ